MKILTVLLLMLGFGVCMAQQVEFSNTYHPGSKLYVHAGGGLALRSTPDVKGQVVTLVKFGEEVAVQADNQQKHPFTAGNIHGKWVKVKYGTHEGYQFDGYLSRWKTLSTDENIQTYLEAKFGIQESTNLPPDDRQYNMYQRIRYTPNVEFEWSAPLGGSSITVKISKTLITYQEIYLLAREMYPDAFTKCEYQTDVMQCTDADDGSVTIESTDDNKAYDIRYGHAD